MRSRNEHICCQTREGQGSDTNEVKHDETVSAWSRSAKHVQ